MVATRVHLMWVRMRGSVILGAALWACAGKSETGKGGSGASGGEGATGGESGEEGGTSTGGRSGGGGGTAGSAGSDAGGEGGMTGSAGSDAGGESGTAGSGATGPCRGLECDQTTCTRGDCTQVPCSTGTSTTVSGTVYDPAGKVPLYNAIVYVPNNPVPPMVEGASCTRCDSIDLGSVTETLTGPDGRFVVPDMPVGSDVPLVIQVGKWRRQITIPSVPRCVDTALTDVEQTSLPSNKTEGDIPRMALTTGGADSFECLLLRMGVEATEFTAAGEDGRIHLYAGTNSGMYVATTTLDSGTTLRPADELWTDLEALSAYDTVILSCEGDSNENTRPPTARQAIFDYTAIGGRVLASHWHHRWISQGPDPMPDVATFDDRENPENPTIATINTVFPKGQALAEWLVNVGASTTQGEMLAIDSRDNVQAVNPMYSTEWLRAINANTSSTPTILNFSFNTPLTVPANMQCGRVAHTGLHVLVPLDMTQDSPGFPFPSHCQQRDLTPQEKFLEFMLFDVSSCILEDSRAPEPPGR
jgi:hypothetical protein